MIRTSRVSIVRNAVSWRDWVATPAELEGLELKFRIQGAPYGPHYEIRAVVERALYAGRFLGRSLFRVSCDDGQVRRVWVDPHGVDSSEPLRVETADAIPVLLPRVGPRVIWKISDDSPELMDLARME